ncbi:MAG: pentapeptide repeat-containing protein [Ilumatobacteraceae bacterium]
MARRQRTPTGTGAAARSDRPVSPRMPAHRDTIDVASITDGVWTEATLIGSLPEDHDGRVVLMEVHLGPATLVGARLAESRLIDVLIDGADLAGVRLEGSSLTRVEVRDARLTGAQFDRTRLRDVRFVRCILDGANFAGAQGERVRFEDCSMTGTDFAGATLDGVAWWDSLGMTVQNRAD